MRIKAGNFMSEDRAVLTLVAGANVTLSAVDAPEGDAEITITAAAGVGNVPALTTVGYVLKIAAGPTAAWSQLKIEDVLPGHLNVKMYGALGDGTTPDQVAIQAAQDALTVYAGTGGGGGSLYFPPAAGYRLTAGVNVATSDALKKLTRWYGAGPPGFSSTLAYGVSPIIVDFNGTGITVGKTAENLNAIFEAEDLMFRAGASAGASSIGMLIQNTNRTRLQNVTFSGFTSGIGLQYTSGYGQYNTAISCDFNLCKIGCEVAGADVNFTDCYWDGTGNVVGGALTAGSKGLNVTGGNVRVNGGNAQSYETLFYLGGGINHYIYGVRGEDFVTGIKLVSGVTGCYLVVTGWFSNQGGKKIIVADAGANNNYWIVTYPGGPDLVTNNGAFNCGFTDINIVVSSGDDAGMIGGIAMGDRSVAPTGNPVGGHVYYSSGGAPRWRTAGGAQLNLPNTALSITGSRGGNAALASFLTQMATTNIIVDNTTA